MLNLIVILFNLLYSVSYVGFYCKSCVWERMWRLKTHWRSKMFSRVARKKPSCEVKHMPSTWLECKESWQMVRLVFTSVSQIRSSRKIPTKHSILSNCHIWYIRSLPILYIPALPIYWEECFSKRKLYPLPLRVRDCHTYNSLYNPLWFSLTPISQFSNL